MIIKAVCFDVSGILQELRRGIEQENQTETKVNENVIRTITNHENTFTYTYICKGRYLICFD